MSDDEEKQIQDPAQNFLEAERKARDDEIVEKYRHFESLAWRILGDDGKRGCDPADVQHMAEMMLLLDIARGAPFRRFRSRYSGYDSNEDSKK
jgi:hypothetical protein